MAVAHIKADPEWHYEAARLMAATQPRAARELGRAAGRVGLTAELTEEEVRALCRESPDNPQAHAALARLEVALANERARPRIHDRDDSTAFASLLAAHEAYVQAKKAEQATRVVLDREIIAATKMTTNAHVARMLGITKVSVGERLRHLMRAAPEPPLTAAGRMTTDGGDL